ncbi:MAG: extracellular solute-binding protein [Clostridiales bacterium]|nr:extracellular solute-binding protein [Clostridiales bacterium]
MKKLALLMCFCLVLSMFSGCAAKDAASQQPAAPAATDAPAAAPEVKPAETKAPEAAPAPAPEKTVTIQVMSLTGNGSGFITGWYADLLKENLGIEIELIASGDQGEQKLQAYMSAGELPDMVVFKEWKQVQDAQRAGLLEPFDAHKDELSNVFSNYGTALSYAAENVTTDGKPYVLPSGIGAASVGTELNWGPLFRWDLYKKLGYPEVPNFYGYLDLLKKMQELEPETPSGQKVYGFGLWSDWDAVSMQQAASIIAVNGSDSDQIISSLPFVTIDYKTDSFTGILDDGGAYLSALKFFYDANQMGLLDPDSLTQRFDTAKSKTDEGRYLFGLWPWMVEGYNTPERTDADSFTGFATIPHGEYRPLMFAENPVGNSWAWGISSKSENIEKCLAYLNFISDPANLTTIVNGPQGILWDLGSDGLPYVTDQGYDILQDAANYQFPQGGKLDDGRAEPINGLPGTMYNVSPYGVPYLAAKWPSYDPPVTKLNEDWQDHMGYKSASEMDVDKGTFTLINNAIKYIPPISDEIQMIVQQIGDSVKTFSWQAVFAKDQAEFDSLVGQMRSQAEELGLEQVMEANRANWAAAKQISEKYK